jgi:predicted transposase/invertase (TIGR01784 family)
MYPLHDRSYKRLFSHPRLFRQLLESFVEEAWVKDLDFEQCEKVEKSFISAHYKTTESDLLYKVKIQGQEAYIYILLEFQSTVTWFMVVRFLHYMSSFWLDYAQSQPQQKKLPAVFPILLYSGDDQWSAPTDLAELLEQPHLFHHYTPQFRYFKIAENEYSQTQLLKISNLVSTLFLAETQYDLELLKRELLNLFDREVDKEAISLLLNWFKQLVVHGRRETEDYEVLEQVYRDKVEAKQMLETAIAKAREQIFAQGKVEGQADLLVALLEMRFNPLTFAQKQYIYELDATQLLKLANKLWQAQSLQDILDEDDQPQGSS